MPDNEEDVPYDEEWDIRLQTAHEEVMNELGKLKVTRQWPQAKIFELYWMSSDTLEEVSKKIGISKSTTFISVKKIRKYLENTLNNPFNV
jgi:DNA-directed RNA polymerase specialized sigma subunit